MNFFIISFFVTSIFVLCCIIYFSRWVPLPVCCFYVRPGCFLNILFVSAFLLSTLFYFFVLISALSTFSNVTSTIFGVLNFSLFCSLLVKRLTFEDFPFPEIISFFISGIHTLLMINWSSRRSGRNLYDFLQGIFSCLRWTLIFLPAHVST